MWEATCCELSVLSDSAQYISLRWSHCWWVYILTTDSELYHHESPDTSCKHVLKMLQPTIPGGISTADVTTRNIQILKPDTIHSWMRKHFVIYHHKVCACNTRVNLSLSFFTFSTNATCLHSGHSCCLPLHVQILVFTVFAQSSVMQPGLAYWEATTIKTRRLMRGQAGSTTVLNSA